MGRSVLGAGVWAVLLAVSALEAQQVPEARVPALVDYVSGLDIYMSVGTDRGVLTSDTLRVYDGEGSGARLLGRIFIIAATANRAVGNVLGEPFSLERGVSVYLGVPAARVAAAGSADSLGIAGAEVKPGADPEQGSSRQQPEQPPRPLDVHGRVSLDFDALRSTTRWGEGPDEQVDRDFNTPTFRLQARARRLPGAWS
jgi:hypothetical protein